MLAGLNFETKGLVLPRRKNRLPSPLNVQNYHTRLTP